MTIDPIGGASPRAISGHELAVAVVTPAQTHPVPHTAVTPDASPRITPPRARRVELRFHEDLRALMTKVIDEVTGDVVTEFPDEQVLDVVADVLRRMRLQEER
jgi:hypothetical protein